MNKMLSIYVATRDIAHCNLHMKVFTFLSSIYSDKFLKQYVDIWTNCSCEQKLTSQIT